MIEHGVTGMLCVPSWVAFRDDSTLVGQAAKDQAAENPSNTIFDSKRLIGREWSDPAVAAERAQGNWPFTVRSAGDGRRIEYLVRHLGKESPKSPEEVAMLILKELRLMAEAKIGPVSQAVITVPAYFNQSQREATKNAGELAGLQVLSVIPEPTAAALYYGYLNRDDTTAESLLVFDFGGGTFDVTILQRSGADFNVLATVGDSNLGGEDVDQILMDLCRVHFNRTHAGKDPAESNLSMWRLRSACEAAKRDLSSQEQVDIVVEGLFAGCDLRYRLTRPAFERAIRPLLDRLQVPVLKALEIARSKDASFRDPQRVILVGGSTKIPAVRKMVKNLLQKDPVTTLPVDTIVAQGAALQAHVLSHNQGVRSTPKKRLSMPGLPARFVPVLYDVSPLSTGIRVLGGEMSVIIPAQTTVPCSETRDYTTSEDNQRSIRISIFEGDKRMADDNFFVGEFLVEGLPKAARGKIQIPVTFQLDANGLLKVTAKVSGTKVEGGLTVTCFNQALSAKDKEEISERQDQDDLRMKEIQGQQSLLQRLDFSCAYLERSYPEHAERIQDLRGKLDLDQLYDLAGSVKLLEELIEDIHSKSYKDLVQLYLKNCQKMQSRPKLLKSKASRSSLKDHHELLRNTDVFDASYYYRIRPVMDEIKSMSASKDRSAQIP